MCEYSWRDVHEAEMCRCFDLYGLGGMLATWSKLRWDCHSLCMYHLWHCRCGIEGQMWRVQQWAVDILAVISGHCSSWRPSGGRLVWINWWRWSNWWRRCSYLTKSLLLCALAPCGFLVLRVSIRNTWPVVWGLQWCWCSPVMMWSQSSQLACLPLPKSQLSCWWCAALLVVDKIHRIQWASIAETAHIHVSNHHQPRNQQMQTSERQSTVPKVLDWKHDIWNWREPCLEDNHQVYFTNQYW